MTVLDQVLLAIPLFAAAAALLLAPGLALLAALRIRAEWPEHTLLAFSASYAWVFMLSIAVPLFEWPIDYAAILTIVLVATLVAVSLLTPKSQTPQPKPLPVGIWDVGFGIWVPVLILICAAVAGWVIEPPFTGEEALDFASLSRFADGGRITFDNTSLLPDTRAVYLVQPYQLALGAIARWAGVDPLVAFIKFRAVLAPLCLVVMYALLRCLTPRRAEGFAAFIVVVVFAALELETWEANSVFPFVRRGAMGAGLLLPALMALCVIGTRRIGNGEETRGKNLALLITPLLIVAATATHALEVFTFLFFLAGLVAVIVTRLDRAGDAKRAGMLGAGIAVALAAFLLIHSQAIPYRAGWDQAQKDAMRAELGDVLTVHAVAADLADGSGSLLARQSPLTTAATLGIPALVIAALRMPGTAAMLALAVVPLAMMYATRAGNIVIALVTSPQFSRDVDPYFMFLGLVGLALGVVAAGQVILVAVTQRFRRVISVGLAVGLVVAGGAVAVEWLGAQASDRPGLFLHVAIGASVAVVALAAFRTCPVIRTAPFPGALAVMVAVLAVPLAIPGFVFGGVYTREAHATVVGRFISALERPDVFDMPGYYEELGRTISPSLPVPGVVISDVRERIPPRQVVLADPAYSCALVVFLNAYCVNPEYVYGLFFQTATPYLADFVRPDSGGSVQHPFFNTDPRPWAEEAELLERYRVSYILAAPGHPGTIEAKIAQASPGAELVLERDGYRLYRVE